MNPTTFIKRKSLIGLMMILSALVTTQTTQAQVNILTQGFEALPFPPTGWSNVRITGPSLPGNWARYGNGIAPVQTPHTGSWQIRFNSHNFLAGTSGDLRTSVLDFTTAGTYTVGFWMYRDNWVANDKLEVFVNTTQTSVGGTLLGTINRDKAQSPVVATNGWYHYTFSVPSTFNTATNYIIFKATSGFGNDIYVDDISIDRLAPAAPGCITTYSPTTGTTGTCVNQTLSWDIVALASGYKISLGSNAPDYNNVANNADLGVALSYANMLSPSTSYSWKITPYNGYGDATGCPFNTFTTGTGVCYCTGIYLDGSCGSEDYIDDFSTTGGTTNISNLNTGCTTNTNNYTYFPTKTVTCTWGLSFNLSVQSGPDFAEGFAVYIDYNNDGDFDDPTEYAWNSGIATVDVVNGSITIPYTATPGTTRLRVRCAYNYVPTAGQACTTFNEGETEDYNITINSCATTTYYQDGDGDGYGKASSTTPSCWGVPVGYVTNSLDCNDADAAVKPGATEICNGIDDNCNALTDDGLTFLNYYVDADADGYGSMAASPVSSCSALAGYVTNNTDCNDASPIINPAGTEICNAVDDDCDGTADDGLTFVTYYFDNDGDGFGGTTTTESTCSGPHAGFVANNTDCNDASAAIKPGAVELCNGIDDNCNATIDDGAATATITPGGPTTFCKGTNVVLQANTGLAYTYQWTKNGSNIAGATNANYTATLTGNYAVKVTIPGGCMATSASTTVTVNASPNATVTTPDGTDLCGHVNVRLKANNGTGYTYQWYKGASALAGATAITYYATTTGSYKVRVTNTFGCYKQSAATTIVKTCRTANEIPVSELNVHPNPASDVVYVTLNLDDVVNGAAQIEMVDITGKLVYTSEESIENGIFDSEINVTDLANGMYFIRLNMDGITYTKQVVINK